MRSPRMPRRCPRFGVAVRLQSLLGLTVVLPMPRGIGALYWPRRCQGKGHKGRKIEHSFIKGDRQTIPSQGQSDQSSK